MKVFKKSKFIRIELEDNEEESLFLGAVDTAFQIIETQLSLDLSIISKDLIKEYKNILKFRENVVSELANLVYAIPIKEVNTISENVLFIIDSMEDDVKNKDGYQIMKIVFETLSKAAKV